MHIQQNPVDPILLHTEVRTKDFNQDGQLETATFEFYKTQDGYKIEYTSDGIDKSGNLIGSIHKEACYAQNEDGTFHSMIYNYSSDGQVSLEEEYTVEGILFEEYPTLLNNDQNIDMATYQFDPETGKFVHVWLTLGSNQTESIRQGLDDKGLETHRYNIFYKAPDEVEEAAIENPEDTPRAGVILDQFAVEGCEGVTRSMLRFEDKF